MKDVNTRGRRPEKTILATTHDFTASVYLLKNSLASLTISPVHSKPVRSHVRAAYEAVYKQVIHLETTKLCNKCILVVTDRFSTWNTIFFLFSFLSDSSKFSLFPFNVLLDSIFFSPINFFFSSFLIAFKRCTWSWTFNDLSTIWDIPRFPRRHDFHLEDLYFYSYLSSICTGSSPEAAPGGRSGFHSWGLMHSTSNVVLLAGRHCRLAVTSVFFVSYLSSIM